MIFQRVPLKYFVYKDKYNYKKEYPAIAKYVNDVYKFYKKHHKITREMSIILDYIVSHHSVKGFDEISAYLKERFKDGHNKTNDRTAD